MRPNEVVQSFLIKTYLFLYMGEGRLGVLPQCTYEVQKTICTVCSLFSMYGSKGLNSSSQTWWQVTLSHLP